METLASIAKFIIIVILACLAYHGISRIIEPLL